MIREAKNNVIKLNEYVSDQMNALASRGETSNDIITNLFTGYMACTDKRFIEYMDKCKDTYKEGEDITYQGIMLKAERNIKPSNEQQMEYVDQQTRTNHCIKDVNQLI
jgi:hypothetical protein